MCVLFVWVFSLSFEMPTFNQSDILSSYQGWRVKRQKFIRRCIALVGTECHSIWEQSKEIF